MALIALEETLRIAELEPAPKTEALRFALAYLFTVAGGDRWPFDSFWMAATSPVPEGANAGAAAIGRGQTVNAALNAIYRAIRVERSEELQFYDRSATAGRRR